jgi:hypothetical protein
MKLQLGVENLPYLLRYSRYSPLTATQKKRRPKRLSQLQADYGKGKTTGDVATELENKYGIMEAFYNMEEDFIVDGFEDKMAKGLASGMSGGSFDYDWDASQLETKFRHAITARKFDGVLKNVPTRAAQKGVSHLRVDPYRQGAAPRPSFMNTSLYMRSFKAWTEK